MKETVKKRMLLSSLLSLRGSFPYRNIRFFTLGLFPRSTSTRLARCLSSFTTSPTSPRRGSR